MQKLERSKKVGKKFLGPVPTSVGGFSTMLKVLPLWLSKPKSAVPQVSPGTFQTNPAAYAVPPESGLRVTWFGHSGLLVEIDGVRLLIDPVWDERASPMSWFGPKRFFAPTIRLEDLPPLDAVLISHDHYDHLGEMTVRKLAHLRPDLRWITSLGAGAILIRFGVPPQQVTELDWTQDTDVAGLKITSVPSRHFSGRSAFNRNETLWAAFVLKSTRHAVYYGADTGLWPGFEAIRAEYGPFDLIMLEVGAFNELWKDIHLGPDGAFEAFQRLGGGVFMPIHWGLFDLALHAWTQPIQRVLELAAEHGVQLFSPEPGLPTEFKLADLPVSDWWQRHVTNL